MVKEKNRFAELLRKHGYAMPTSEEEVGNFENKFGSEYESPKKWSSVKEILNNKGGFIKNLSHRPFNSDDGSAISLSMAAREGKEISDVIKNKMKEDRKNAKKK
ncbi:hypothetical protein DET49_102190 [Salegentibacter sp. 24]|uniref:hypothetical protein n=1 Tax=Salegentibacter sp. 24 TaxID=2183986 RepID=UPI00105CF240|nr:hypothetical protein [Salegentibacter sp. 24]TDN95304.1 hypothetical protein DET49_102190 [Salegentibacter sp. 24]